MCHSNILKMYLSMVRPVLEYAVPVWEAIPAYLSKENKRKHVSCMSLSTHTLALAFFPYVVPVFRLKDEDVKVWKQLRCTMTGRKTLAL